MMLYGKKVVLMLWGSLLLFSSRFVWSGTDWSV